MLIDGDASDELFDLLCMVSTAAFQFGGDSDGVWFGEQCLVKDPSRRPGWEEIMQHPWFDGLCVLSLSCLWTCTDHDIATLVNIY